MGVKERIWKRKLRFTSIKLDAGRSGGQRGAEQNLRKADTLLLIAIALTNQTGDILM